MKAGVAATVKARPSPLRSCAALGLLLLVTACEGSFFSVGDRWRSPRIEDAYAARDACLVRKASQEAATMADPGNAAHSVMQACSPEVEKLVQISNRDGDTKVAENIRTNSESRAMRYVLLARARAPAAPALATAPDLSLQGR